MSRYNELREELRNLRLNPSPLSNDRIIEITNILKKVDSSIKSRNYNCLYGNYKSVNFKDIVNELL